MPTAPKCKLCGSAHWSTEPHAWKTDVEVRPSQNAREHAVRGRGRAAVQEVPPEGEAASPASDPVDRPRLSSPRDIAQMTLEELRSKLATKRAAQAAYMRGYRLTHPRHTEPASET